MHVWMLLSGVLLCAAGADAYAEQADSDQETHQVIREEEKGVLDRLYEKSDEQGRQELEVFHQDVQEALQSVQAIFDDISQKHHHVITRIKAEEGAEDDIYLPLSIRLTDRVEAE